MRPLRSNQRRALVGIEAFLKITTKKPKTGFELTGEKFLNYFEKKDWKSLFAAIDRNQNQKIDKDTLRKVQHKWDMLVKT